MKDNRAAAWLREQTKEYRFRIGVLTAIELVISLLGVGYALAYYMSSGVYGTTERGVKNRMKQYTTKDGKTSKVRYVLRRLFPRKEVYQYYLFVDAHKWILPGFYIWRMIRLVFVRERRERILREVKIVRKVD